MTKRFEDYFSGLQADMVAVCLEYVGHDAEEIYIYGSYEPEMYAFDVFYKLNGRVLQKHELNDDPILTHTQRYDLSEKRQEAVLNEGLALLEALHQQCIAFGREMPTEMKLVYDVKNNSLKGTYLYDLVYSHDDSMLPDDVFELWIAEVKREKLKG